jgi:glycosyltransferase involved in cell wall biosynthesis
LRTRHRLSQTARRRFRPTGASPWWKSYLLLALAPDKAAALPSVRCRHPYPSKGETSVQIALVSASPIVAQARATVSSAFDVAPTCAVQVLDLDGSYASLRDEDVVTPQAVGLNLRELHVRAMLLVPVGLVRWTQPALLRHSLRTHPAALAVSAGVLFLQDPSELTDLAAKDQVALIARSAETLPADGTWPGPIDLLAKGSYSPHLLAVSREATAFLDLWEQMSADPRTSSDRWLDVAASHLPHHTVHAQRMLISPWTGPSARIGEAADGTLEVDDSPAVAVDLTGLDPDAPWLLNAHADRPPRVRLSAHPMLAGIAARYASQVREDAGRTIQTARTPVTSLGVDVHARLRAVFRAGLEESPSRLIDALPDPFDPGHNAELAAWLVQPVADGSDLGLGRYLASIYRSRPDVMANYPGVPGEHVGAFLNWADRHGRHEVDYSPTLIDLGLSALRGAGSGPAAALTSIVRRRGVNVVGYLRGELGVGESARLMLDALTAGAIPHATASVDRHLQSRQGASYAAAPTGAPFDTTLLCVNADMTATVAAAIPSLLDRSYRIGMWYWEVEDFPTSQHEAFRYVDEVWVASDFVRRAIEPHSPVPVRTITPPLPQPRIVPHRTRADLGLPERPTFLFAFDYLSTVERKNPWGLVDAFEAAFSPGEGPLLVIKSINARRRPDQAERLRLRVAGSSDILLLEDYLSAEDRDALVALSDCYVSLHRSEGLGLTMAEAMALGKPVIATGYSGNLQFMTDENSFLVPWTPTAIPAGCEPYPPGGTWAEPDLVVAARLMQTVLDDKELAAARGRQAAEDMRVLHSPEAAGRQVSARLAELAPARRDRRRRLRLREDVLTIARRLLRG